MESTRWIWQDHYDHPSAWEQSFPPLTMPELLRQSVDKAPDAPLADFYGRKYSYAEVMNGALRVACGLQRLGVAPGERVGLYLPNVPHYIAAYYGAMMMGAVVVNFSPLYTADELIHQAEDSGTRILFTLSATQLFTTAHQVLEASCIERLVVGSIAGALPAAKSLAYRLFKRRETAHVPDDPRIMHFSHLIANDGACALPAIRPDDLALLQYTGGTTGTPKGAMLTHQNLTANARQLNLLDPSLDKPDRIMGVLPFFHVFANTVVLNRTIAHCGEIVMLPRFDARQTLAAIGRVKTTALPGVPTMFQALLDSPALAQTDFSAMRICISGGAPLPEQLKARFEAATGVRVVEGYGLTESSGVVSVNPYELPGKSGTIGQPLPDTRVRLLDREDPSRLAPPGEPGEIAFSGPQMMRGYWNRPDADADIFAGGYLRTGDVGVIDADGYIRVIDRIKDMIAVGGFKVFPSVVEDVILEHPAVKEALVIGVPEEYRGEVPRAYVTLNEGASATGEELAGWLNAKIGKHERVDMVVIRESLPKTMIGKLDRKTLRAEVL